MDVKRNDDGVKGSFEAYENEVKAGTMTYTWLDKGLMRIDHTEVDEAFGGRGVGKKLLMAVVEYARENNIKIKPVCPFAKSMFEKIEAIRDVLK